MSETTLLEDIASHLTETIKSDLRKSVRYDVRMCNLKLVVHREFKQFLTDKQLMEVSQSTRAKLLVSGINLYVDDEGMVAGRPMTSNWSHSLA